MKRLWVILFVISLSAQSTETIHFKKGSYGNTLKGKLISIKLNQQLNPDNGFTSEVVFQPNNPKGVPLLLSGGTLDNGRRFVFDAKDIGRIVSRGNYTKTVLFSKKNQNIVETAKIFLKKKLNIEVESNPIISLNSQIVKNTKNKYKIVDGEINIMLGVGGSGPTKRVSPEKFIQLMKLCSNKFKCKFFLAAGSNETEEQIVSKIMNSEHKDKCVTLNKLRITETLPIIKNCNISVCNDTSFSHLSAALGIETIILMTDTPLLYGNYSPKMHPILPDGEKIVSHDTLGKDKINPEKIFNKLKNILNLN